MKRVLATTALFLSTAALAETAPPLHRAKSDADGDGRSDIIVLHVHDDDCVPEVNPVRRHYNGHVVWGHGSGVPDSGFAWMQELPSSLWQVAATGDFDGDGRPDLFWEKLESPNGPQLGEPERVDVKAVLSQGAPGTPVTYAVPSNAAGEGAPPPGWAVVGSGDFAGIDPIDATLTSRDGMADLLWYDTENGNLAIWVSDGRGFPTDQRHGLTGPGGTNVAVAVGDLDGDTLPEVVFRDDLGTLTYWKMDGLSMVESGELNPSQTVDANWRIAGAGDFNGDGFDDLLFWNADSGRAAFWLMTAGTHGRGPSRITGDIADLTGRDAPRPPSKCDFWKITGPR